MDDKYLENIAALEEAMTARDDAQKAFQSLPHNCLYYQTVSEPLELGDQSLHDENYKTAVKRFKEAYSAAKRLTEFLDQLNDLLCRYRKLNESDIIRDTGALTRRVAQSEQELIDRLRDRGNLDRATDTLLTDGVVIEELESTVEIWNSVGKFLRNPSSLKLYDYVSNSIRSSLKNDDSSQLRRWNIDFFNDSESKKKLVSFLDSFDSLMSRVRVSPFRTFSWNIPDLATIPKDVLYSNSVQTANDFLDSANVRIERICTCMEEWSKANGERESFQSIVSTLEQLPTELVNEVEQFRNCMDSEKLESKSWTESSVSKWSDHVQTIAKSVDHMFQTVLRERTEQISRIVDQYINMGAGHDDVLLPKVRSYAKAVLRWNSIAPNYVQIPPRWREFNEDETGFRDEEYNVENMVEITEYGPLRTSHQLSEAKLAVRAQTSSRVACFYAHWLYLKHDLGANDARALLEKVANDNFPQGMNNFAVVLCREEHYNEAQSWFTKAAALGNAIAEKNLILVQLFAVTQDETTA